MKDSIRFVGGEYHGQFLSVDHDTQQRVDAGGYYVRRCLTLSGRLVRHEEVCMVLRTLSTQSVGELYFDLAVQNTTLPKPVNTKKLRGLVESSLIRELAYDADTQTLDVKLKGADKYTYRYDGVTPTVLMQLLTADSLGSAYNQNIRGKLPCVRLNENDPLADF